MIHHLYVVMYHHITGRSFVIKLLNTEGTPFLPLSTSPLSIPSIFPICLQCIAVLVGWQEGHLARKKLSGGMLACLCLGQGADLHMAQLMPLPLTISCSSKSRLVLPS